MPGAILVRMTKAQAAGQRKPMTTAAARSGWTLPIMARSSGLAGPESMPHRMAAPAVAAKTSRLQRRVLAHIPAKTKTVQPMTNADQPMGARRPIAWTSGGG